MATGNRRNESLHREELQSALQRLGVPPNYPEVGLLTLFTSPGKGCGLKAARDILRGTPLLSESAIFTIVAGGRVSRAQGAITDFRALSCTIDSPTPQARFDANSFQMGEDAHGNEIRGIFVRASRFNHSCIANAYFAWNSNLERLTVHAVFDISEGDEIFLNYLPKEYLKTTLQRQQQLGDYNFNCACPACQPNTEFKRASEERRKLMRRLSTYIEQNKASTATNERNNVFAKIKAFGVLLEKEGLFYPQLADVYEEEVSWYTKEIQLARNGVESARWEERRSWEALQVAREKLDWDVVCNGYDSPEVSGTLRLICGLRQG